MAEGRPDEAVDRWRAVLARRRTSPSAFWTQGRSRRPTRCSRPCASVIPRTPTRIVVQEFPNGDVDRHAERLLEVRLQARQLGVRTARKLDEQIEVRGLRVLTARRRTGDYRSELGAFLVQAGLYGGSDQALACLLALNALRVSEACGAYLADLALANGHHVVQIVGKGNQHAPIPLAPRTVRAIDAAVGEPSTLRPGRRNGLVAARPGG